ncbi:MAG: exodeoxyribonuclease III [Gemmatimonadales bacterium]
MILATWNVNSIRARLARLLAWLERTAPDVACLQELKVPDEEFPVEEIRATGYHAVFHGQKTYNGVAILSRSEPTELAIGLPGDTEDVDSQARLIAATCEGVRVVSAYFPNGQTVGSEKWAYKLGWMERLREHLPTLLADGAPLALCGDFNVAPEDRDVARPDEWRSSVLCHEDARKALAAIMGERLIDTIRLHEEGPGPYSWWDYRMLAFPKGNGLRIDHIVVTPDLAQRCTRAWVERNERKGKLPSDHAPVLVELS